MRGATAIGVMFAKRGTHLRHAGRTWLSLIFGFSCAQGFNFPALQGKSRFELFFDKVFVTGALVKRDGR